MFAALNLPIVIDGSDGGYATAPSFAIFKRLAHRDAIMRFKTELPIEGLRRLVSSLYLKFQRANAQVLTGRLDQLECRSAQTSSPVLARDVELRNSCLLPAKFEVIAKRYNHISSVPLG